jgi:hypothetical protein
MGLLPQVLHLPADPRRHRDVAAIVELLAGEVGARRPGSWAAAGRLLDTLLIAAIRHWAELQGDTDVRGWLPALRDPHEAKAKSQRIVQTTGGAGQRLMRRRLRA